MKMEDDNNTQTTERECVSTVLQNIPVILEKIFNPLPMKTLNTCSRVCKTWYHFVKKIKQERKDLAWLCVESEEENVVNQLRNYFQNLSSEPAYVLLFCTSSLYEDKLHVASRQKSRFPRDVKRGRSVDIETFFSSILPKSCNLYGVTADGTIGSSGKSSVEIENAHGLTFLSIPKLDGLEMFDFYIDIYKYANRMDDDTLGMFDVEEVSTVPPDKTVKAVLFFCDEPFCPPEIGYSLIDYYKSCVVAGGYVDNLVSSKRATEESQQQPLPSLHCIAICGANVHVASVILKDDLWSPDKVLKSLTKLKECNLPTKKSFAFMFACIGRGSAFYGQKNIESSVFKKLFPDTPLFGFFGNGEVGFNFLHPYDVSSTETAESSMTIKKRRTSDRPPAKLYHAYTTVFLLVSISEKI